MCRTQPFSPWLGSPEHKESWPELENLGGQSSSMENVTLATINITQADVIPCDTLMAQEQWTQVEQNKSGFSCLFRLNQCLPTMASSCKGNICYHFVLLLL